MLCVFKGTHKGNEKVKGQKDKPGFHKNLWNTAIQVWDITCGFNLRVQEWRLLVSSQSSEW